MKILPTILVTFLLTSASADKPLRRKPTNTTIDVAPIALQNLGKKNSDENMIVGGTLAATNDFPSFVLGDGCGANLIHTDIVLTAAHCQVRSRAA